MIKIFLVISWKRRRRRQNFYCLNTLNTFRLIKKGQHYFETLARLNSDATGNLNSKSDLLLNDSEIIDEDLMIHIFKEILSLDYDPPAHDLILFHAHLLCFYIFYSYFTSKLDGIPLGLALKVDFSFTQANYIYGLVVGGLSAKGKRDLDRTWNSSESKTGDKKKMVPGLEL